MSLHLQRLWRALLVTALVVTVGCGASSGGNGGEDPTDPTDPPIIPPIPPLPPVHVHALVGAGEHGGAGEAGAIFEHDLLAGGTQALHTFTGSPGYGMKLVTPPSGFTAHPSDGTYYGFIPHGGTWVGGGIVRFDPATRALTTVYSMGGGDTVYAPNFAPVFVSDDVLYGVATDQPRLPTGSLFRYTISTDILETVHVFDRDTTGWLPQSQMILASNGRIYGTCTHGGVNSGGTLWVHDPTQVGDEVRVIVSRNIEVGESVLWGATMAELGGQILGALNFSIGRRVGNHWQLRTSDEYYFEGNGIFVTGETGWAPGGHVQGLAVSSANQKRYSACQTYGAARHGSVVELGNISVAGSTLEMDAFADADMAQRPLYDVGGGVLMALRDSTAGPPAVVGEERAKIVSFDVRVDRISTMLALPLSVGTETGGVLTPTALGVLGMGGNGGSLNQGSLFEYDRFNGFLHEQSLGYPDGAMPRSGMVLHSNGKLYSFLGAGGVGTTTPFAFNLGGGVMELDPVSGATRYVRTREGESPNDTYIYAGYMPPTEGADGMLYAIGFAFTLDIPFPTLLRIDPTTLKMTSLEKLGSEHVPPFYTLVNDAGTLYGVTDATVFSYEPAEPTLPYTMLHTFTASAAPALGLHASVGVTKVGTMLYGATIAGGAADHGVLYQIDLAAAIGTGYSVIHEFTGGAGGAGPSSALLHGTDGKLYGLTRLGGSNDKGTLFVYDPAAATGSRYQVLHHFDGIDLTGEEPEGVLTQLADGRIVGANYLVVKDSETRGLIYSLDPKVATPAVTVLVRTTRDTGFGTRWPQLTEIDITREIPVPATKAAVDD